MDRHTERRSRTDRIGKVAPSGMSGWDWGGRHAGRRRPFALPYHHRELTDFEDTQNGIDPEKDDIPVPSDAP